MKTILLISMALAFAGCSPEVKDFRRVRGSANSDANKEFRLIEGEIREDEESYVLKVLSASAESGKYVIGIVEQPSMGKVFIGKKSAGVIEYKPDPNVNGDDRFVVGVVPENQNESELRIEVKLKIIPVDDAPVVQSMTVPVDEDSEIEFDVLMVDADGDKLELRLEEEPKFGKFEILDAAKGTVKYIPNPNASGKDTAKVVAFDGNLLSDPATITFEIGEINDPPTVRSGLECLKVDNRTDIPVFGEDPVENSPLVYTIDSGRKPSQMHGLVRVISNSGVVLYDPTANRGFQGWDVFYVQVSDGMDLSESKPIYLVVYQDKFAMSLGSTLQSTFVNFQNIESQDGPKPSFQFFALPTNQGVFEIPDPAKAEFKFIPNANIKADDEVDVFYRIKLNELEAKQCTIRIQVKAAQPAPQN